MNINAYKMTLGTCGKWKTRGNKRKSDQRRPNKNAIKQFWRWSSLGGHKLIKYLTYILYNIQHILISPILRILIIFFKCIVLDSLRLTCFFDNVCVVSWSFDKTLMLRMNRTFLYGTLMFTYKHMDICNSYCYGTTRLIQALKQASTDLNSS